MRAKQQHLIVKMRQRGETTRQVLIASRPLPSFRIESLIEKQQNRGAEKHTNPLLANLALICTLLLIKQQASDIFLQHARPPNKQHHKHPPYIQSFSSQEVSHPLALPKPNVSQRAFDSSAEPQATSHTYTEEKPSQTLNPRSLYHAAPEMELGKRSQTSHARNVYARDRHEEQFTSHKPHSNLSTIQDGTATSPLLIMSRVYLQPKTTPTKPDSSRSKNHKYVILIHLLSLVY